MGAVADAFNAWLSDYVTYGVPASGVSQPSKAAGRSIGALLESYIAGQVTEGAGAGGAIAIIRDITLVAGAVTAGAGVDKFRAPSAMTITDARASLNAASSSGPVKIDINAGGNSLLASVIQVDQGATTSVGSTAPVAIGSPNLFDDTEIEIDVDAAGTGATGLRVTLIGVRTTYGVATMPYFVASSYEGANSGNSATPAYPGGIAANDIAIMVCSYFETLVGSPVAAWVRPSGWTQIGAAVDQGPSRTAVYWKRLLGTESGTQTVSLDGTEGAHNIDAAMSVWRGCVGNGAPYEALAVNGGDGNLMAGEAVITTGANRLVLSLYACTNTSAASSADVGWTDVYEHNDGWDYYQAGSAQAAPLAATVAAETRSLNVSANWASFAFALLPGP